MFDLKLREEASWAAVNKLGPLTTCSNATDMVANLADILLLTVTDVSPHEKRQRGLQGWFLYVGTHKEIADAWLARERAGIAVRST